MGHKDKSWTVPRADERPRGVAQGRPGVGRGAGAGARGGDLDPHDQGRRAAGGGDAPLVVAQEHGPALRREARAVAAHLEVEAGETAVREAAN